MMGHEATSAIRLQRILVPFVLAFSMLVLAPTAERGDAAQRFQSAAIMRAGAASLLAALRPEQTAKVRFEFGDPERLNWHYIPRVRKGLPFKDMDPVQQRLAHGFLAAGLSQRGYIKATTIMSLEGVLKEL